MSKVQQEPLPMQARSRSLKELFLAALDLAAESRSAWLDRECVEVEQRQRLLRMLAAHDAPNSLLDAPGPPPAPETASPPCEKPETMIGPYKLLESIGEGGMGTVWMAQQAEPVKRVVAVKLIKAGMDSKQVVARFEAERQALALMDHPNIARVLDGGTTPEGRPYFVMELVRGLPVTDYCDRAGLPPRDRLRLFVQVCQAVQHAHQKGIIHRDLKPSNVLVTLYDGVPVPKVIDFGVAKAVGQKLTDRTFYTGFAQLVGSPLYMSPEQAEMSALDVDTRADVYALGVLLYELLTGVTPFDAERFRAAGLDEVRRIIREDEPPRPSARLSTLDARARSTVSQRRGLDDRRLSGLLRGDLDWIVMKSLEKDRTRRYESASALAADVQRFLNDEPVQACPPSVVYRLRKFARRNRFRLATAAMVLGGGMLIVLALGVTYLQKSGRVRQITQAVAEDLKEADVFQGQGQWAEALPALERASGRLEGSGLDSLQTQVAERRRDVALVARLENVRLISADEPDLAAQVQAYRAAFAENGLDVAALAPEEIAQRIRDSAIRIHLIRALDNWAYCQGGVPGGKSEPLNAIAQLADEDPFRQQLRNPQFRKDRKALEALAQGEAVLAQPPESVMNLFSLLEDAGATAVGVQLLRRAQALHPADFWINFQLGFYLSFDPASAADAVGYCRAAMVLRPRSPRVHFQLGDALELLGRMPEAEAAWHKALELKPDYAFGYFIRGQKLFLKKKYAEAAAAFRTAIQQKPDFARAYECLGWVLEEQKQYPEAVAAYRKAIALEPGNASTYRHLGEALRFNGDAAATLTAYEQALKLAPSDAAIHNEFAWFLANVPVAKYRDPARALASARKAVELEPAEAGHWNTLGVAHYRNGDWMAAAEALSTSVKLTEGGTGADFFFLAMAHFQLGEEGKARTWYDKAVTWMDTNAPDDEELKRFRAEAADLLRIPKASEVSKEMRKIRTDLVSLRHFLCAGLRHVSH